MDIQEVFSSLGIKKNQITGNDKKIISPIDGKVLGSINYHTNENIISTIQQAKKAFLQWRLYPAPQRGELIRLFGDVLRQHKDLLGQLITIESGKILEEGKGEVQEMIDICDFAVGLSRQIGGHTFPSERPFHRLDEHWLPLGVVGVISAFNFPAAVWAWNTALALVCGDTVVWKPSEKTPLTALACHTLFKKAITQCNFSTPEGLVSIILGEVKAGELLVDHPDIALVSATGSSNMGKKVGPRVQKRFGKILLELGGNNAIIVTPSANLERTVPPIVFGSIGTCGQRCTTTRRLFVHSTIADPLYEMLKNSYTSLIPRIGNPLDKDTLVGPLIDGQSFEHMQIALRNAEEQGGKILTGGQRIHIKNSSNSYYVEPALVSMPTQTNIVIQETFAPILYLMKYDSLDKVMALHNAVPQGLSSAIFTQDIAEAEYFKLHSDCGIANVNIGTSGAEIGGAFGGEKETGGGRESGSDAWKTYMRRQTSTTYFGTDKPALAQGIQFE